MNKKIPTKNTFTTKDFKRLEPTPEEGIRQVTEILRSGNLFRYSSENPLDSAVVLFEQEFAKAWGGGMRHALAVNSCSSAILLALKALDVKPGDKVLAPAFTFTAVPSAIADLYAEAVLVEINQNYTLDIEDLKRKITSNPSAKILLLSHMRGYISDMDAIMEICRDRGLTLVEDAAHALGSRWNGKLIGSFGKISCYSFQSYKLINAGEGGLAMTDDDDLMAKMILDSGAYESLCRQHVSLPPSAFDRYKNKRPLFNVRMSNVTAAIARSQLPHVTERIAVYRGRYAYITGKLRALAAVELPESDPRQERVPDSLQFRLKGFTPDMMAIFLKTAKERGVPLAGFGADKDNARAPWNWSYLKPQDGLEKAHAALDTTCDMRLTTNMTDEMCDYLVETVRDAIGEAEMSAAAPRFSLKKTSSGAR
ncbi:MAG: aminotransferase class I/II-fold pyridoxal phosphate-dependent enzyme [Patescibacteria group bacterium]|nr:aminotransferase class I/II-fold pyridoxal phosphate-dependent enzyme [Patescibacteria group bacterium]MDE2172347.1 aminotransferase class I/II-fold pyridoxal phosphate-dependent enzyme [Patescibacteria group bacterium]